MSEYYELGSLKGLISVIKKNLRNLSYDDFSDTNGLYCPKCGEIRRMKIECVYAPDTITSSRHSEVMIDSLMIAKNDIEIARALMPSVFYYQCVQCEMIFTAFIYEGPDGPALAVLPTKRGGLVTPHTPDGVAFYLDQADRAKAVGANSAAIAMFRGALEQLLFEQGYEKGLLKEKIDALITDRGENKAPAWASTLDDGFLTVIKDLGNTSIHPNGGDIKAQAEFDSELISGVMVTFSALLHVIYEAPIKTSALLADLKKAAIVQKHDSGKP